MNGQIKWERVPQLTARLIAIEALLEQGDQLPGVFRDGRGLLGTYDNLAGHIPPVSVLGQPPLESRLQAFWRMVQSVSPRQGLVGHALGLYDSLDALATRDICASCSPGSPCTGENARADSQRIASKGKCLSPLWTLCELAETLTITQYRQVLGTTANLPAVQFQTGYHTDPNNLSEVAFSAMTRESHDGAGRDIIISFILEKLRLDDFEQLLYALVHEYFVHAMCGVPLDSGDADLSDSFHEGWMDTIAFLVLERYLQPGRELSPAIGTDLEGFRDNSRRAHLRRHDNRKSGCAPAIHANALGRHTARRFVAFCEGAAGPEAGITLAIDFSVAMNASQANDALRGDFVSNVAKRLAGGSGIADALVDRTLTDAIDAYRRYSQFAVIVKAFCN
ncbi:hypothetical protein [Burkholderia sp. Se-20378]|uniref:hypothetical protein n=1 Tax=Burkholderia sp. Se-20378 TaxID=2703899 RepID=UPI00197E1ED7|nr:hypothetical protein [Burkholderia sp. Se-20378]MBN3769787.1 hypothetical protein [Burkholderia sp. Se-20378]